MENLSINTPLKPKSPYAAAKAGLYNFLSQLLPIQSIEFCWCRLFYLYGEGENKKRLVPYLHEQLSKGKVAELTSGEQVRDFLNVSEAGKMIAELAVSGQQGAINICSGIPITIKQLAEQIADKYGRRDLLKFGVRAYNLSDPKKIVGIK
jgi:dTDP-6-deoxy-L-talose 4-dehydrogenase (NAD+)